MNHRNEGPPWAWTGSLSAVVRTSEELTIVCDQTVVSGDLKLERNWVAFKFEGPLPFSLTGILSSLLGTLASCSLPVFVVSTIDTDYILVKADQALRAKEALQAEGHQVS